MAAQNSDIAVVGHLSIDTINLPSRTAPFVIVGGSATYTSFAAKCLDAAVSVISKVGGNFPQAYLWWLSQEGMIFMSKNLGEQTTCFELTYSKDLSECT
jgi:sugar/nucleoside kinase (ribokinase family)